MTRTGRDLLRAALARHVEAGGALVGEAVGVHGVTEGLTSADGTLGILRTPLSESATLGVAAGLALAGQRVIVEFVDPNGIARAADILAELGSLRARSNGAWSVPLVIRAPFSEGLHAGVVPAGIQVAVASTADDLVGLLRHALAAGDPVLLLEAACAFEAQGTGADVPGLGVAVARREGAAVTVLAVGDAAERALITANALVAEGVDAENIDATVIDLRARCALDRVGIGAHVRRTGRAVVVGVPDAALVSLQEAFFQLESPLLVLPAGATGEQIAAAVRQTVHY